MAGTEAYTVFLPQSMGRFEGSPTTMLLSGHTTYLNHLGWFIDLRDDMGGAMAKQARINWLISVGIPKIDSRLALASKTVWV